MQILFFDAFCVMCNGLARFVAHHNRTLQFASLQGNFAKKHLPEEFGNIDSLIFLDELKIYIKSAAVFELLKYLSKYKWLRIFRFLPLWFTDRVYDWVARNRYSWFGSVDSCPLPEEDIRKRFILD